MLNHSSLDGYLFLRFLRVLGIICLVGVLLLWPVLIPLHITGGAGNRGLDALTLGNVVSGNRLYAHAVLAWVYFGILLPQTRIQKTLTYGSSFYPIYGIS